MTTPDASPTSTPPTSALATTSKTRSATSVGPTARLLALPQLPAGIPKDPADVDEHLSRIERARQAQLDSLPEVPTTVVAAAHRRIVAQTLEQVRAARDRIRTGTYGLCARCSAPILAHVLESQPWQPSCSGCARSGAR